MVLVVDHAIFIYLGIFTVMALIVSFCLSYWCLKGKEMRNITKMEKIGMLKEMVEVFKCCIVHSVGYSEKEPSPMVWTCSCDLQIYS